MYKSLSLCLLFVAILFGCAITNAEASSVSLHMFGSSSAWWVAVQPRNDDGLTSKVELKDASSSSFTTLTPNKDWGYYSASSSSGGAFIAPFTFRLTSISGATITVQVNTFVPDALIDSGAIFGSPSSPTVPAPSKAATSRPTAAATSKPANPSTSAPSTSAPSTSAPTQKATSAPTTAPTTRPTAAATTKPSSGDLCAVAPVSSEPVKIMVPLYVYPGAAWDSLIAAASKVKILAIINPNSGPLSTVDSTYASYMTKMKNAGIEMVGYVYTSYGARDVSAVKADIDTYVSKYPLITGIFLDEGASDASKLPFYTEVYNHITAKPGYQHVILNPGVQPDAGYLAVSTNIMVYENYASSLASTTSVTCATSAAQKTNFKYHFSGVAHTAAISDVASYVQTFGNRGFGYVYVTDGVGGCCTYNSLTTYFPQLASAVAALNGN